VLAEATTDQGIADLVAKLWPVVAGLATAFAAGWAWAQRKRRAAAKEREEQRLQGKAVRYLLDAQRQALHALVVLTGAEGRTVSEAFDLEQLVRHRELVGQVSDELWVHDGHASEREIRRKGDVKRWATRTQAIALRSRTERLKPIEGPQDMFRDSDLETK